MKYLIFTDLDGTLLDYDTYEWWGAGKSINYLKKNNFPIIFLTSKTFEETIVFRKEIGLIDYPFAIENGGAIYFPKAYEKFLDRKYKVSDDELCKIEIGMHIKSILPLLKEASKKYEVSVKTIFDFSNNEFKNILNLKGEMIEKVKKREYDIPFIIIETNNYGTRNFFKELKAFGLKIVKGGRFYHLSGEYDKGMAAEIIYKFYKKIYQKNKIKTIGLGDSENDLSMLKFADIPVLVKKKDGFYSRKIKNEIRDIFLTKNPAPEGWNEIFEKLFLI